MHRKCIPHFDKLLHTFCIQNLATILLLILYKKSIHKFIEMLNTFCIHLVYILYTSVVYILYNFYIQNVYTISDTCILKVTDQVEQSQKKKKDKH